MKTIRLNFETATEMNAFNLNNPSGGGGWGEANNETRRKFIEGDTSEVREAEDLIEKMNDVLPETMRNEWHSDVFGPVVSVPDFLSNSPIPFKRERVAESSCAPVKIVASLTSSTGLSHEVLKQRGIAILALLMKIQLVRPVDLILYCEMGIGRGNYTTGLVTLKMESRPLNIGQALIGLANSNVARQIFYNCIRAEAEKHNTYMTGAWPREFSYNGQNVEYYESIKKEFGMEENDVYIPPTFLTDMIIKNPVAWLNENLQKLVHFEDV